VETHPLTWISLIPGIRELPAHTVHATLVMVLLVGFAFLAKRQLAAARARGEELVPDATLNARNLAELLVGGIQSLTEGVLGPPGRRYVPLFGSFFIFILIGNLIGLVPGFSPPTSDFNITLGLGLASFLAYNAIGIQTHGLVQYFKHFVGPILWLAPLMVPLELIDNLVRPMSLALRLFGNMTGDHLVLEIFTDLTKLVVPVVFYMLGAFVSLIQAFVFTLLTIIYVSLAIGHAHAEEHH
jgi:F-type H+-transporting ATPase subunit a